MGGKNIFAVLLQEPAAERPVLGDFNPYFFETYF